MANSNKTEATAPVEQNLNKQEEFFLKYRNQIIAAVAALIIIIAGVAIYNTYFAGPRETKAATALAKAQTAFVQQDFNKALNGDKTTEGFLAITENYSCTDAANLANLYAGLCYANMGKWQEAIKYLEEFSTKDDAMISPAAMAALGNAYANVGETDKAVSALKKAAKMANSEAKEGVNYSIAPTFLMQAAILLESQKKNDEALEIYKDIKKNYVNSVAYQTIDKYIERLEK